MPYNRSLPLGDGERILVVDDDATLRDFLCEALDKAGYRVSSFSDGQSALVGFHQARENGTPFELVLMDIRMPGMNGKDCAESMLKIDPDAKVLLMSGDREAGMDNLRERLAGLMSKPFGLREMLQNVKTALAADPPSRIWGADAA